MVFEYKDGKAFGVWTNGEISLRVGESPAYWREEYGEWCVYMYDKYDNPPSMRFFDTEAEANEEMRRIIEEDGMFPIHRSTSTPLKDFTEE